MKKPPFVEPSNHKETKARHAERVEALRKLHDMLRPGDEILMVLRHRSASGMYRAIDFYFEKPGRGIIHRRWLSRFMATAGIGRWDDRREAVGVSGTGMDMGFHCVYNLSSMLYPKGWMCIGERCPSSDHSNGQPVPHPFPDEWAGNEVDKLGFCPRHNCGLRIDEHPTKPAMHRDGGYALRYQWL